MYIASAVK